ncbi:MAG: S8 family serine peptidase [Candidatus Obscuribacterales bacterium]|nr:S8 family serine peptidase [Candidatus Obscuribacterales bacterium]
MEIRGSKFVAGAWLIAASLFSLQGLPAGAQNHELRTPNPPVVRQAKQPAACVPDQLLVMASGTTSAAELNEIIAEVDGTIVRTIGEGQLACYVVQTKKNKFLEVESKLSKDKHLAVVQRNFYCRVQWNPNDPYYPSQWGLPAMNLPKAWDSSRGANQRIAVLDTGCGTTTRDLGGRIASGYDAVRKKLGQTPTGDHGTMVASTAVANCNNKVNCAAVAPSSVVYPVKICDTYGAISEDTVIDAIYHTGTKNIKILNLSVNSPPPYSLSNRQFHEAFHIYADWYHNEKGGLLFLSAGNDGMEDTSPRSPNIITVSAISNVWILASFSNYGSNIWFTAPGQNIYCTNKSGQVVSVSGTSFSAPAVAGVAALVWAARPALKNTDVEKILINTCQRNSIQPMFDKWYGYGLPNAELAVKAAKLNQW